MLRWGGQYAHICVQVNIGKSLKKVVHIGYHSQLVIYEGLNMVCFAYGKLGHKTVSCPNPILHTPL